MTRNEEATASSCLNVATGLRRSVGALWAPPSAFGADDPRPPKGFPLFSALKMASPDTIILLVLDYHAAIGIKTPVTPCVCPESGEGNVAMGMEEAAPFKTTQVYCFICFAISS